MFDSAVVHVYPSWQSSLVKLQEMHTAEHAQQKQNSVNKIWIPYEGKKTFMNEISPDVAKDLPVWSPQTLGVVDESACTEK